MNFLADAQQFDAEDRPVEAADAYEESLSRDESEVTLATFTDLAVLYFVCNDGGYAAHHQLSKPFLDRAWERMFALLEEATDRFGDHPELRFWHYFFAYFWFGGESFERQCVQLVSTGQTLVPYFYLFAFSTSDPNRYRSGADDLLQQVAAGRTAKQRYIRSVLEAAFRQR